MKFISDAAAFLIIFTAILILVGTYLAMCYLSWIMCHDPDINIRVGGYVIGLMDWFIALAVIRHITE